MNTSFFNLIMLAMAVYVLIGGITGKGKLYAVDGVPEEKLPQFKKTLRILYIVMGLFMAMNTGTSYLRDQMYTYEKNYDTEVVVETAADETAEATAEPAAEATAEPEATAVPETTAEPAAETTAEPAAEATPAPAETTAETADAAAAEPTATPEPAYTYELRRSDKFPQLNIPYKTLNIIAFVMLGITMAAVVGMFVVINKFVDKEAARKAQEEKAKKSGGRRGDTHVSMPSDAFEFDDEPEEKPAEGESEK